MPSSFTAQYLAVRSCAQKMSEDPEKATAEDIDTLNRVLSDPAHSKQTCAHFLYLEAAMALSHFVCQNSKAHLQSKAWEILNTFANLAVGSPSLAAAQALGSLPLSIQPPDLPAHEPKSFPIIQLPGLIAQAGLNSPQVELAGRSMLFSESTAPDTILVLKTATTRKEAKALTNEAWWMQYLAAKNHLLPNQHIPRPLRGCCRINCDSLPLPVDRNLSSDSVFCLPYLTRPDYFTYALDPDPGRNLDPSTFDRVLAQAALGLGRLSREGIVHKAPIPLFHNRAQSGRRDDNGLYIWTRGGRLDRWFASCLYPNFGLSGLRDFEHLEIWSGYPRDLFQDLGTHILSLVLTIGSWFRLKNPKCMGLTTGGEPVDARHLFDRPLFTELLTTVVREYSTGFLGAPLDLDQVGCTKVVDPLIEALGVDRHMTEIFRTQDQMGFTPQEFLALLGSKALDPENGLHPGEQDIVLLTGPHLGEFNSRISVPELINFTAATAGLCIARAYFQELPGGDVNCFEYSR
jgi:hypothetical protein